MTSFQFDAEWIVELGVPLITFLVTLFTGVVLRRIIFARLAKWAENTTTELDDIVIGATRGPFLIWCAMFGIYFALAISRLPEDWVHVAGKIMVIMGIFSGTMVLANISSKMVKAYSGAVEAALPVTSLTQNIARIAVFGIGILIILNIMGISITPILATLGVGGLAVALALQDTLSNLFAGFHMTMARQIKVGDFVKLESGEEGNITDINWRSTKIKTTMNNVVLVPNDKLIKSTIISYSLPDKEMVLMVGAGVHYDSDLAKVEKITHEVAKEVMKEVPGGVPSFDPLVRFHTFGDFSVNFNVILRVKEFTDQGLVKHEFVKRLHARYAKEGIIIPYPIKAIGYEVGKQKQGV